MPRGWVVGVAAVAMAAAACGGGGTKPAAPTTCPTASPQSIGPSSPPNASTTKPSCVSQPAGEHWTGTVDMEQHSICPASQKGQVDFDVDSTGQVPFALTGTGDWMRNGNPCNPKEAPMSGSGPWGIFGRRTGQEFQLTFRLAPDALLASPVTVPIVSPNTASAQGTDHQMSSGQGPIFRTYAINLTCTNC
jgi:hypothetical protein